MNKVDLFSRLLEDENYDVASGNLSDKKIEDLFSDNQNVDFKEVPVLKEDQNLKNVGKIEFAQDAPYVCIPKLYLPSLCKDKFNDFKNAVWISKSNLALVNPGELNKYLYNTFEKLSNLYKNIYGFYTKASKLNKSADIIANKYVGSGSDDLDKSKAIIGATKELTPDIQDIRKFDLSSADPSTIERDNNLISNLEKSFTGDNDTFQKVQLENMRFNILKLILNDKQWVQAFTEGVQNYKNMVAKNPNLKLEMLNLETILPEEIKTKFNYLAMAENKKRNIFLRNTKLFNEVYYR